MSIHLSHTSKFDPMNKAQMINAIMEAANSAAICAGKEFDRGDMFFTLAFMNDTELKSICKKLRIAAEQS